MDLLFVLLYHSDWILIVTGALLWCWPKVQQRFWPNFKSGIRWEQVVWGYRRTVVRRFLALVCVGLGLIIRLSPTRTSDIYSSAEPEIRWLEWLKVLTVLIMVSIGWFTFRTGSQREASEQEATYWKQLTPAKRIAWVMFVIVGSLIGYVSWLFVRSVTRSIGGS